MHFIHFHFLNFLVIKWYECIQYMYALFSQSQRRFGGRGESDSENSEAVEDDFVDDDIRDAVDEDDDGEDLLADGFEKYVI